MFGYETKDNSQIRKSSNGKGLGGFGRLLSQGGEMKLEASFQESLMSRHSNIANLGMTQTLSTFAHSTSR